MDKELRHLYQALNEAREYWSRKFEIALNDEIDRLRHMMDTLEGQVNEEINDIEERINVLIAHRNGNGAHKEPIVAHSVDEKPHTPSVDELKELFEELETVAKVTEQRIYFSKFPNK